MRVTGAVPPIQSYVSSNETPGSFDNDPKFRNLADQLWESLTEWRNDHSDLNAQNFLTSINNMMDYLGKVSVLDKK